MLKDTIKRNKSILIVSVIMSLITVLSTLAIPFMTSKIFGDAIYLNKKNVLILLGILVLNYVIQIAFIFLKENFAIKFNTEHLNSLLHKLFNLQYDKMLKEGTPSLIERLATYTNTFYLFLMSDLNTIIASSLIIVGSLYFIFKQNIIYGFIMFAMLPITFFGYKALNKKLTKKSMTLSKVTSKNFQDIRNIYGNPDFIKQFDSFKGINNMVNQKLNAIYVAHADINKFAGSVSRSLSFINDFVQNALLILLTYDLAMGRVQIGSLVIFTIVTNIYFQAVYSLNGININYVNLKALKTFIDDDIIAFQEKPAEDSIGLSEINSISFSNPVIKVDDMDFKFDVQADFKPGDIVNIDGASGSGKSTLIRSLLGIRDTSGISINQMPLDDINKSNLRARIAYGPQNPSIISGSLRENILVDTYKDADVDAKIRSLEILQPVLESKNLDTEIFQNGDNLSGGEKQRVSIARGLLKDADVYIFDEVTSNLDGESQEEFFSSFINHLDNKIVFIISHDEKVKKFAKTSIKL